MLHHRSDEYLMEVCVYFITSFIQIPRRRILCSCHILAFQVVGEGRLVPAQRSDLLEAPSLRHEFTSVSCPIIEHTESAPAPAAGVGVGVGVTAPPRSSPPPPEDNAPPCDIKLVINGCSYNDAAAIPLLADA